MSSSIPLLFVLGALSSLSPCFFPLFPPVLAYIANVENSICKGILAGSACVLGVAISFTIYGFFAAFLFSPLLVYGTVLRSIFGVIIILMGIAMYTSKMQLFINARALVPQKLFAFKGYLGALTLGLSYTLIAAPCAMPIFSSAILVAIIPGNLALTTVNLLFFTLGVILPFLVSSLAVMLAQNVLRNQYQAIAKWVTPLSASILILTGLLLFLPLFGFPSIFY